MCQVPTQIYENERGPNRTIVSKSRVHTSDASVRLFSVERSYLAVVSWPLSPVDWRYDIRYICEFIFIAGGSFLGNSHTRSISTVFATMIKLWTGFKSFKCKEAHTGANHQVRLPAELLCLHRKFYIKALIYFQRESKAGQSSVRIRIDGSRR